MISVWISDIELRSVWFWLLAPGTVEPDAPVFPKTGKSALAISLVRVGDARGWVSSAAGREMFLLPALPCLLHVLPLVTVTLVRSMALGWIWDAELVGTKRPLHYHEGLQRESRVSHLQRLGPIRGLWNVFTKQRFFAWHTLGSQAQGFNTVGSCLKRPLNIVTEIRLFPISFQYFSQVNFLSLKIIST